MYIHPSRRNKVKSASIWHRLLDHLDVTRLLLALSLLGGTLASLALKDGLAVLVKLMLVLHKAWQGGATYLQRGDDNVGGVDSDGGGSGVGLLDVDSLDVDNPLLTVDLIVSNSPGSPILSASCRRTTAAFAARPSDSSGSSENN